MEYINTYYTEEARERDSGKTPLVSYTIESGKVDYVNEQQYNKDFSDDFNTIDSSKFEEKFNIIK